MTNQKAFEKAKEYIPGGVNSPVRAFKSVKGSPIFIERGKDEFIYDIEGKKISEDIPVGEISYPCLLHCSALLRAGKRRIAVRRCCFSKVFAVTSQRITRCKR